MPEVDRPPVDIVLLTHADSDLAMLARALRQLPADFPPVAGTNLQSLTGEEDMAALLQGELKSARIVLLRLLGRASSIPGFDALMKHARERGQQIVAISGTGELN